MLMFGEGGPSWLCQKTAERRGVLSCSQDRPPLLVKPDRHPGEKLARPLLCLAQTAAAGWMACSFAPLPPRGKRSMFKEKLGSEWDRAQPSEPIYLCKVQ